MAILSHIEKLGWENRKLLLWHLAIGNNPTMCFVERFNVENSEFVVQELATPQHGRRSQSYTLRLNDWWCDCGHFQALRLPCRHVIVICSSCHLQMTTFIDPVYNLHTIRKAYQVEFHPV